MHNTTYGAADRRSVLLRRLVSKHMNELGLIVLILLLYIVFANTANGFLSRFNQQNILRDAASLGIAAFGATLIIIAGDIDVSVGPMVAFLSVALSYLLRANVPTAAAILLTILFGIGLGSIMVEHAVTPRAKPPRRPAAPRAPRSRSRACRRGRP